MAVSSAARSRETPRYDACDVVVVPFPYADRLKRDPEKWSPVFGRDYASAKGQKRRPALVVSNRKLATHGVVWVAMITSADNEAWSSDVAIADLARAGLPAPSVVRPAKLACIDPQRIDRRIGTLDKAAARMVGQRLRGFLG